MAITVTPNLTLISDCDDITGWSPEPNVNSVDKLEGSDCLADQVKSTTGGVFLFTLPGSTDMTGKMIIMTMKVNGVANTKANGGYRIVMEDSGTNQATWYVGGSDTHPGGWGYFAVDPSTSPDVGSVDYTDITKIGVQFDTLTSVVGTADNCFWDICWYGTGITVTSADGDGATFEDLYTADATNFWGIIQKVSGVYFVQGLITLDDGSTGIDFTPDSEWVVWKENEFIPDSLQGLTENGYSGGVVNIEMANCVMKGDGITNPYIDLSGVNIDVGTLNGCTFVNFAPTDFTGMDSIAGTAFDACGQVVTEGCVIGTTAFRNSVDTDGAFLFPADSSKASDLSFTLCDLDIEYAASSDQTTPTFTSITHDDNAGDYDVNNTDAAETIVLSGTSNANSYTGFTTTFSNPKNFSFTLSPSITGYEWRLYEVTALGSLDGAVEMDGEETATADNQSYNYTYTSDQAICIQLLVQTNDYVENTTYYTLGNADQDVTILLTKDDNN